MKMTVLEMYQMRYDSLAAKRAKMLREVKRLEEQMNALERQVNRMSDEYLAREIEL